ncbi:pyocin S6 family toxin immunity protein [Pseudomonas sp. ABY48]|uniref:pyocin S6 family toxin immunity protein n=1 Tax=Pseudomonas sp. ABY48 TaxID=3402865 RepID=UPI003B4286EF
MSSFLITGFYPDEKQDDSLQFEIHIKSAEQNEALAQITEAKPFNEIEPGEVEINEKQFKEIETILDIRFPAGLEYFIGTCAD